MNSIKYKDVLYEHRELAHLKDLLDSSAALFRDKDAFLVKDKPGGPYRAVSFGEFKADVDALGTALLSLGLAGKNIALLGENRYEWVVSYLAVTNGVGVVVPLDRELCAGEIAHFITRADVGAVIYSGKGERVMEEVRAHVATECYISMDAWENTGARRSFSRLTEEGKRLVEAGQRGYLDARVDPESLCAILFTSGVMGMPKGVMLSHKNIAANIRNMSRYVDVTGDHTGLSVLPMHHTYEMTCHILTAVYQGCRVAICEGLKHILKNMAEAKASVLLGVPLIFENMHRKILRQKERTGKTRRIRGAVTLSRLLGGQNLSAARWMFRELHQATGGALHLFIAGGAPMDPEVIKDFCAMGIPMIQGYGMTESAPIIALNKDKYSKPASVGLPLPDTEVQVIDVDEDGIGEIVCRGDSVMMGYYRDEEETKRVLVDGWLHTGDLGYFDGEGFLYVTGRKKNIIVTKNGKNISPEEIENYLYDIPYIREVLVWGLEDGKNGDVVVCADIFPDSAFAWEEHGRPLTDDELKSALKEAIDKVNEKMPLYKRVKRFALREEEFEKTTTKKIKRAQQSGIGRRGRREL
ncbi:MAG: AMP-binding protein [Clostridiales Family XIII bacterium]|nr:AMP-binding protein [Clostridiales Family XIII bacterium]